ncbi:MAG: B12-binding domain-containing radical SAM protein [Planctomycetes bacterium]|nr:B12-binding domain-containing radical SAM protein [Planctomycetota bacterium]
MKIMLVDPPAREDDYDKAYPNLGILQLISYVVEQTALTDDDVVFLDQFHSLDDHIRQIEEHKPAIYGISFAFLTQRLAYYTINEVKKRFPDLLVIAGGPHPTSVPEDVLENTAADIVCIGEGETFMAEVVNKVHAGDFDFSKTLGVLHRVDGKMVNTGRRPSVADLDTLPFMAWDRIDFTKFVGQHYCKSTRQSCIVISRGCPYHCTFCSLPVWRVSKPSVRMRSPENIAREVQWLYELGVREIKIVSDELNITLPWAKKVCRAIADLGHKDLYFQTNLRADKMDNELAALFADMNMWLVHLGCESSSDRVLTGIQKKITIKQVEDTLVWLKRNNIRCLLFMMMFNMWEEKGELKFERPREVLASLFWSWKQFLLGRMQYMTWSVTTPMPGAPLFDIVKRHGLDQTEDVLNHWDSNKDYLGIDLSSLGVAEWKKMWLLRAGILTKACFMMVSGQFDWRRHFFRVGILMRSFTGRWRVKRARKNNNGPLFGGTPLRTKVEG